MNQLAKKDLFICLGIWLALEAVSVGIVPAIGLSQPGLALNLWHIVSVPMGIGGAFLLAYATQLTTSDAAPGSRRRVSRPQLASLSSWAGLAGIGFPLLVISVQIFTHLFNVLKT